MPEFYPWFFIKCHRVLIFLWIILICPAALQANPDKPIQAQKKQTIVLDPGHGGHDNGASGPEGTFEKNVTLELARMVAKEFENTYRVILTRTDDYFLDIPSRTSTANHEKADLFISIHVGGSFLHQPGGITLYFFKRIAAPALTPDNDPSKSLGIMNSRSSWSNIQNAYQNTSKNLSKLLLNRIDEQKIFKNSEIIGAPLMVLEGADMPAVCLEIGYITNPAEEKSLRDIRVLSHIAQAIRNGIDDFFEKFR